MCESAAYCLLACPTLLIGDVAKADIAKRQTAAVYLKALAAEGILQQIKAGRENLYINPPLLAERE